MIRAIDTTFTPARTVYIISASGEDYLMVADPKYANQHGMSIRLAKRENLRIPLHRIPLHDAPTEELKHVADDQPHVASAAFERSAGKWK